MLFVKDATLLSATPSIPVNECSRAETWRSGGLSFLERASQAYFLVAHRKFLRFDFSDMVSRTPSANPAADEIKIKTA